MFLSLSSFLYSVIVEKYVDSVKIKLFKEITVLIKTVRIKKNMPPKKK